MKRYRYGLNCATHNTCQIHDLTPVGYYEVVPGDTFSGSVRFTCFSAMTGEVVLNRCYLDTYAFYVPYRLLDSGFPDFLVNGTGSLPTVADLFPFNYEKKFNLSATTNNAFQRYMYNFIWNSFFRPNEQSEAALTDATILQGYFRPSTFHEAVPEDGALTATTIDTSGPTLSIDEVRDAFNTDQFNKVRDFY